ncbi:type VII secretion target [Mycobacterium sp.]|uniref:type VII secretion target n=1 Tax=Mycobacterium sp. TaxID=1785 RepID=UPI0031D9B0A2
MGSGTARGQAFVDAAAVHALARHFDAAAELVDAAAHTHLGRLAFGGPVAGQGHGARGEALRAALGRLAAVLAGWARADREIAATLRAAATRYAETDRCAAARIG